MVFDNISYENVTYIHKGSNEHIGVILNVIVQAMFFGLGLILQVKIIIVARKEKGSTWQIHVCHSILLVIFYSYTIPFEALMYFSPFMSSYTVTWFCHVSSFLMVYCLHSILNHSLLVAVMKYTFIVHLETVREFGTRKVQKIFLWINLCFPLFWTALIVLTSERMVWSSLNTCFQHQEQQFIVQSNTTSHNITEFFICEFGHDVTNGGRSYILYIFGRFFCLFATIGNTVIGSNLPEAFFYYKIFRTMRR